MENDPVLLVFQDVDENNCKLLLFDIYTMQ